MKTNYLLVILFVSTTIGISMMSFTDSSITSFHQSMLNGSGGPAENTGAPGENTCATCHGASLKVGGSESSLTIMDSNQVEAKEFLPNHTYSVTFANKNIGSKGFQLTVLDTTNAKTGTLTAGTNSKLQTSNNRQYISHTNSNKSSWTFSWKAPASPIKKVIFYVATGDRQVIYTSKYTLTAGKVSTPTTGLIQNENAFSFNVYQPNPNNLFIGFKAPTSGNAYVNIVNLEGRTVHYSKLGEVVLGSNYKEVNIPSNLENGTYIVQLFVDNYFATKKIVINN